MVSPAIDARDFLAVPKPTRDLIGATRHLYGWQPAAHHKIWVKALTDLLYGKIPGNRLLIVAPPGHAKTNWGSIAFGTWAIGMDPYTHVLVFSATQGQSGKTSQTIRDTVGSSRWKDIFPEAKPDRDRGWAAHSWYLKRPLAPGDKDPTCFATGVGGETVLGSRGKLLLFDDVSTQANTATALQREKVTDWLAKTAMTRAVPGAAMVGIMTRWHSDDVAGFFEREGFTTIVMPANGYWENPNDTKHADINGGPLWPEHVKSEDLLKQRQMLGDFRYTAVFQGNPTAVEGAIFREEYFGPWYVPFQTEEAQEILTTHRRVLVPPYNAVVNVDRVSTPLVFKAMFVDTAMKAGQENDYTVMSTWGVGVDRQAYLLDVMRDKIDAADMFDRFILAWRAQRPDLAVIEDTAAGVQLIQDIQRKTSIPVSISTPIKSKEERARAQVHVVKGAFHIPDPETGPAWVTDFLLEHGDFPRGSHDDMVDTTSMAAEHLRYMVDFFERDSDDVFNDLPDQPTHEGGLIVPGSGAWGWAGDDESSELGIRDPFDVPNLDHSIPGAA